jgi:hypothetical protein
MNIRDLNSDEKYQLRMALTGKTSGASLNDIVRVLGKDEIISRISMYLHFFTKELIVIEGLLEKAALEDTIPTP